jgi:hypothetical protein
MTGSTHKFRVRNKNAKEKDPGVQFLPYLHSIFGTSRLRRKGDRLGRRLLHGLRPGKLGRSMLRPYKVKSEVKNKSIFKG